MDTAKKHSDSPDCICPVGSDIDTCIDSECPACDLDTLDELCRNYQEDA